ncbi:hypothetical protein ACIGMX_09730 [Streptomyces aquilus]|uniref:DUF6414 family protein n=1 Tax=Streptomyces aquilus TaxID=2548456 RepID=UPI0037D2167C
MQRAAAGPILREFVYLDEVSVTSLLSSRLGALPSEYTETLSSSIKSEVSGSIGADAKVIKSGIGSRFEATQSKDSQVLRKSTIQATFKDLCDHEKRRNEKMVTPEACAEDPPSWSRILEWISNSAAEYETQPWVLDKNRLARGELLEVKVKLRADPTYRVSSIISTMADLVSNPYLAASINPEDLEEAKAFNGILESLMAGLVPLKCELIDYSTYTISGSEYVVHRSVESELADSVRATRKPLYLVGVTEQSLYWKDIRRVLFSDSPVWALCRISVTGIQSQWTPVKLVEVLKEVVPGLGNEIDSFSSGALNSLTEDRSSEEIAEQRARVLILYSELIAGRAGLNLNAEVRARIETIAHENVGSLVSFTDSRRAFQLIVNELEERFTVSIDSGDAVRERGRAWQLLGVSPGGAITLPASPSAHTETDESYLDSEFVAIYW